MKKITNFKYGMVAIALICCSYVIFLPETGKTDKQTRVSLTLVPPSPVTNKVKLDIRGAIWNNSAATVDYKVSLYIDNVENDFCVYSKNIKLQPGNNSGIQYWLNTEKYTGEQEYYYGCKIKAGTNTLIEPVKIIDSKIRSTKRIDGSWFEFYHWSEDEGRFWNKDIIKLSNNQWGELIKGMHDIDMNIVVIQELFRNQKYVGQHTMESTGYTGFPYYNSKIYPLKPDQSLLDNVENGMSSENYPKWKNIAADSALESVLSEADKNGMKVFLGVGMYAWFDFYSGIAGLVKKSCKGIMGEIWYHINHFMAGIFQVKLQEILETIKTGKLNLSTSSRNLQAYVRTLAPDKPVMLATNCHDIKNSDGFYPAFLKNLDILCPFGFHRMPENDYTGKEAAKILQDYCDNAGSHLWMDLEVFLFGKNNALYPRPVDQVVVDLLMFDNFEKICCYSYTGLMNAGWQTARPGGEKNC